jgi:hypothetical protein
MGIEMTKQIDPVIAVPWLGHHTKKLLHTTESLGPDAPFDVPWPVLADVANHKCGHSYGHWSSERSARHEFPHVGLGEAGPTGRNAVTYETKVVGARHWRGVVRRLVALACCRMNAKHTITVIPWVCSSGMPAVVVCSREDKDIGFPGLLDLGVDLVDASLQIETERQRDYVNFLYLPCIFDCLFGFT